MITAFFDGSYHQGKNIAGIGWVIYKDEVEVMSHHETFDTGKMSTNWAEYRALRSLLEYIKDWHGPKKIYGDSKLVVEQMNGNWKATKGRYVSEHNKCKALQVEAEYEWIPRKENGRADELSKYR